MPERSRDWYHHLGYERAPAELGLGDAELAPAGDYAVIPHAGPALLTRRPYQGAAEVALVASGDIVESGNIVVPPAWMMAYTRRGD